MTLSRRRQWHPTPVLLPGKSCGWRSLMGCSPWGHEGSDTTERLHFHFSLSRTGEGNGSPLQRSCLENPGDGGAWWAAVCGVAQSHDWSDLAAAAATLSLAKNFFKRTQTPYNIKDKKRQHFPFSFTLAKIKLFGKDIYVCECISESKV